MAFSKRVVATDKLPYVDIDEGRGLRKITGGFISHLREYDFLGSQLSEEGFKLCPTYVVIEGTQVELASRAVQNADPETSVFPTFLILPNGETMAGLVVDKELIVNQSPVGVDLI
jgi:hypothetical protein